MARKETRRVALVTGVGRRAGIGAAICRALAGDGFDICYSWWGANDRANPWGDNDSFGATFDVELAGMGVRARGIEADLADAEVPASLVAEFNALAGEIRVLVNNAAVSEPGGIEDVSAVSIDRHLAVNARGMALLTQAFVLQFAAGEGGRVINLTSGQSLGPMPDELAYAMSKGAVEAFTTSLSAAVMARGITVNAVNPGPTDTGWIPSELQSVLASQFPAGRIGRPEDAARVVAFLAGEDAGWITGQVIHAEGGFRR